MPGCSVSGWQSDAVAWLGCDSPMGLPPNSVRRSALSLDTSALAGPSIDSVYSAGLIRSMPTLPRVWPLTDLPRRIPPMHFHSRNSGGKVIVERTPCLAWKPDGQPQQRPAPQRRRGTRRPNSDSRPRPHIQTSKTAGPERASALTPNPTIMKESGLGPWAAVLLPPEFAAASSDKAQGPARRAAMMLPSVPPGALLRLHPRRDLSAELRVCYPNAPSAHSSQ